MSGYSGTPLPKKLGIREGSRVAAIAAAANLGDALVPWPSGAVLERCVALADLVAADGRFDVILLFAGDAPAAHTPTAAGDDGPVRSGVATDADGGAGEVRRRGAKEGLADRIAAAAEKLEVDGGLWVAWAKMKSPLFSGLKDSHVREAGLHTGLVDNKVCAIDDDWSGLRFVFRKEDRARVRAERAEG